MANNASRTHIRDFHDDDVDGIVRLWQAAHAQEESPVYSLAEVIASCHADHAVVAMRDERVIGAAIGRAAHAQGWIVFFGTSFDDATDAALLDTLERRMAPLGLGKLSVLVPGDDDNVSALTSNGFEVRNRLRYLERKMPVQRREIDLLKAVGGRVLPRHLWEDVAGMRHEKALLEERLVIPLGNPEIADRFGVVPPRAVMLFGPPGTGKTTFARAVASRLDWPFVELFPSRLGDATGGMAAALRSTFDTIAELEHAVVFIDEVEEIASRRGGEPPSPTQGVTNELLKSVAEFRESEGRLLVCATNFVRSLDAAFLRHGRFDYVLPIGLPDELARRAIWARYVPDSAAPAMDFDALVAASAGLTPADIEYAARRASQEALARALRNGEENIADDQLGSADYLAALRATRATVSEEAAAAFLEDIDTIARL
ncbi:ATP-binding protein [Microbacterium sp. LRZ72]|uniref:ATP-binding protein n=1 Tax=Microbacterium sp. LRZ72 TaxID=2942481 RepID=UPI0029B2B0B1|nr:ATP-binding protein [Microbacterium sp. LRZ72]MDX2376330.1 ATP-binding protein [Microbacterium sp. LRZ72]